MGASATAARPARLKSCQDPKTAASVYTANQTSMSIDGRETQIELIHVGSPTCLLIAELTGESKFRSLACHHIVDKDPAPSLTIKKRFCWKCQGRTKAAKERQKERAEADYIPDVGVGALWIHVQTSQAVCIDNMRSLQACYDGHPDFSHS